MAMGGSRKDQLAWGASNKVAVVLVEGEITESRDIIERLHNYSENDSVRAMIVRINSPGGAVAPSQEIFAEIRRIRQTLRKAAVKALRGSARRNARPRGGRKAP